MTWDFAECNFFSESTGNIGGALDWISKAMETFRPDNSGELQQHDAQQVTLPSGAVISTDPPYYDNIGYADLSDYFYVWLRPNTKDVYPSLTETISVPKSEELVATPYRHGGKTQAETFFLSGMTDAISQLSKQSGNDYPATIYYAFKQSEIDQEGISSTGWATFLQAVIRAGYAVVGTWPVRTERAARTIATGTNALANSVVLVCRKRKDSAETIGRAEFIRALRRELPPAIEELQKANISPADMPQSAIGPGMGVFSQLQGRAGIRRQPDDREDRVATHQPRTRRVSGRHPGRIRRRYPLRHHLVRAERPWPRATTVSRTVLPRRAAISVDSVKHAGIVDSAAGKVRILKRDEIDAGWDPAADAHLTVWECCQHLIRELEQRRRAGGGAASPEDRSRPCGCRQGPRLLPV